MTRHIRVIVVLALLAASCAADGAGDTTSTVPPTTAATTTTSTVAPTTAATTTTPPPPAELVLVTHDSFAISEAVLSRFEDEHGATVRILKAGDAGSMVNQAILTKDNPLGDVLFGVDNTFLSRAVNAGIFLPYRSPLLESVPENLRADSNVTPIDYGDVCINYDKAAFDELPAPANLLALTDPAYRGQLVVENPATSSPGLAFLLATIAAFPDDGVYTWRDFWADLRENDVLVTSGWEEAYFGAFTFAGGDRPLVVSYASSPPAEIVYAEGEPPEQVGTAVVTDGCFRQIEFAGVLNGTDRPELARAFIDFMLSVPFQEDIPLNMFVFPANRDAAIPEVFLDHTAIPTAPLVVDPAEIEENREAWIEAWTAIVLR